MISPNPAHPDCDVNGTKQQLVQMAVHYKVCLDQRVFETGPNLQPEAIRNLHRPAQVPQTIPHQGVNLKSTTTSISVYIELQLDIEHNIPPAANSKTGTAGDTTRPVLLAIRHPEWGDHREHRSTGTAGRIPLTDSMTCSRNVPEMLKHFIEP